MNRAERHLAPLSRRCFQQSAFCLILCHWQLPKKELLSAKVSSAAEMVVKTNTQKHFQSQLTTVDKNNKHMTQSWSGNAQLKTPFAFSFDLHKVCAIRFNSVLTSRSSTSRHSTYRTQGSQAETDKALVSHSSLELFEGATGLSVPLREYGRAEVRPIRGKWKPYAILMKQGAGAHDLLLQEHLLPERNVHLALIVSQPIK